MTRLAILAVPALLLIVGSLRMASSAGAMLWLGAAFQVLIVSFFVVSRRLPQTIGPSVAVVYLIGLAWMWMANPGVAGDWFYHFAQFVLLVVPLLVIAMQTLIDSGALLTRRARVLAERLANRKDWPAELTSCRTLPEVKALREALSHDATPALVLLQHPRPQVRMAALAALEFRKSWRPGQPEVVLRFAQSCKEPALRACAISALGNLDERIPVEMLAEFLRDPDYSVRRAATEALLWDAEHRWAWIRHAVRAALVDPALQSDGALGAENIVLKPEAVTDLMAWATEKGCLGVRAALTLAAHYRRALNEQFGPELVNGLRGELANMQTPPLLRIELAQILRNSGELDRAQLERLVDQVNPGPLRLIAADALLEQDRPAMGYHQQALAALREIAKLPNREMALAAADIVQRRLCVDLGLPLGQPLPAVHSRQAADVTRRLMQWAGQQETQPRTQPREDAEEETMEDNVEHPDTPGGAPKKRDHGSGFFNVGSATR